ncbi:hypothetical protein Emed_002840 [Eimeria media]
MRTLKSGSRSFAPWRQFLSDRPAQLTFRVRLLLLFDCIFVGLVIASLSAPWYRQEWRVANGETLTWTLALSTARFKVDCSSDSPEFLDLCQILYGRLAGDLRTVTRSICNASVRVQDTDMQTLFRETCNDVKLIEKLSVGAGSGAGICLCLLVLATVAFLVHVGTGYFNRRAWRASFLCRSLAWVSLATSCVLYCTAIPTIEDLFHFHPSAGVAFDPAHAEPISHDLLYGFIIAIATVGMLALYLPFWWKAAPFDPDPYVLEPGAVRQGLLD